MMKVILVSVRSIKILSERELTSQHNKSCPIRKSVVDSNWSNQSIQNKTNLKQYQKDSNTFETVSYFQIESNEITYYFVTFNLQL